MASSESTVGIVERVQGFVSENKRAVIIGAAAAAIAVGGVAYYASTSSRPRSSGDVEKARKEKKKSSKSGKKKKTVQNTDGPILEERDQPVAKAEAETGEWATSSFVRG
jgi:import receptor subunit TOM70